MLYRVLKLLAHLDEQFLWFSGLGFLTLVPLHCIDLFVFRPMFLFFVIICFIVHSCRIVVTQWGVPDRIEVYCLGPYLPSVL